MLYQRELLCHSFCRLSQPVLQKRVAPHIQAVDYSMNLTTLDCQHERSVTAICAQILVDLGVLQKFLDNFMAAALASIMQRSTTRIILPIHVIIALSDHNNTIFSAFRSGDH